MAVLTLVLGGPGVACGLPPDLTAQRAELLAEVNAVRAQQGVAPLRADAKLDRAAQEHACDSARHGRMSHTGSDGSHFAQRIALAGYRIGRDGAAENLGFGYRVARAVVQGWMASPGHRRNILAPRLSELGVGLALERSGRPHWVIVAASPR
ncbi:MAG TPA: CAP domain-containing protein [Paracoccaceae bacterium]|nr:CAP domain-containing protein [Paracoccaceae bacterium]